MPLRPSRWPGPRRTLVSAHQRRGKRSELDEHSFNPVRALVTVGAPVQFLNNGQIPHSIAARDGSWTTGTLQPAMSEHVTFDQPGTFLYHCTDHPWAIGEITVQEEE